MFVPAVAPESVRTILTTILEVPVNVASLRPAAPDQITSRADGLRRLRPLSRNIGDTIGFHIPSLASEGNSKGESEIVLSLPVKSGWLNHSVRAEDLNGAIAQKHGSPVELNHAQFHTLTNLNI